MGKRDRLLDKASSGHLRNCSHWHCHVGFVLQQQLPLAPNQMCRLLTREVGERTSFHSGVNFLLNSTRKSLAVLCYVTVITKISNVFSLCASIVVHVIELKVMENQNQFSYDPKSHPSHLINPDKLYCIPKQDPPK